MDSILESIKKLLGIPEEYTQFDQDILMHINTAMLSLKQLGVGPEGGYAVSNASDTWRSFCGSKSIEAVRSYVYLKVRLLFDPPTSSALIEAIKAQIAELEWRLCLDAETTA